MNPSVQISVARKIWLCMLGLLFGLVAAGLWTQKTTSQMLLDAMAEVEQNLNMSALAIEWRGLTTINSVRRSVIATSNDAAQIDSLTAQMRRTSQEISAVQVRMENAIDNEVDRRAMARIASARERVLGLLEQANRLKARGDLEQSRRFVTESFEPVTRAYIAELDAFVKMQEEQVQESKRAALLAQQAVVVTSVAVTAGVLLAGVLFAVLLVRTIRRPLAQAVALAQATERGDLTLPPPVQGTDEFAQLMRAMSAMVGRLRELIGEVRQGAASVSSASAQISAGSQDLSARTEQAAANLQQTASAVEQLSGQTSQSLETVRQASAIASIASAAATEGGQIVQLMVESMGEISHASSQVVDIVGVIDAIAFQTNLLALNAAVEAARAGEQGRGFAVVANEVRALAGRSAEAAKEVKALILSSSDRVNTGMRMAGEAGAAMNLIVTRTSQVTQLMDEMSAAAVEQNTGIGQIHMAVAHLDQSTQQNAALVEESTAAAVSLHDQAQRLAEKVAMFRLEPA